MADRHYQHHTTTTPTHQHPNACANSRHTSDPDNNNPSHSTSAVVASLAANHLQPSAKAGKRISIASANCQGGFKRSAKVADVTNTGIEEGVQIILLQETNIHPTAHTNSINHIDVPDDWAFAIPSKPVTTTNRGKGVAIITTSSIMDHSPGYNGHLLNITAEAVQPSFEVLAGKVGNLTVVSVYVHCSYTPPGLAMQRFHHADYGALRAALANVPDMATGNVVVGGDFNFPNCRHDLENQVMEPLGLMPAHDNDRPLPTRGSSALDLFYWKGPDIRPVSMRTVDNAGSDHSMLILDIEGVDTTSMAPPGEAPPPLPRWSNLGIMMSAQGRALKEAMIDDLRSELSKVLTAPDPISATTKACMAVAIRHLGSKKYRQKVRQAWWSHKLTRLHRKLRHARTATSHPTASQGDKDRASKLQHAFQAECQAAKRKLNASLAAKFEAGDVNIAWLLTGRHRGKKTARYLRRVAANPDRMVEFWEAHFTDAKHPRPPAPQPQPHLHNIFNEFDVNQATLNMEDNSPGPDGLRVAFLKMVGESVARVLAEIFNRAARVGIDEEAKTSFTVFLRKRGGSATNPADYRPIALQPVMTKLLEKLIEGKIWEQIEKKQVRLSDDQGGFRPFRSRFDLIFLVKCVQDHHTRRKLKQRLFAAFLDIAKAYDSVPHIKIIEGLRKLGVREELVHLVLDLLTKRYTTIYGRPVLITRGVPQGGPLSPLLFILAMMQPLSDAMESYEGGGADLPGGLRVRLLFYADDVFLVARTVDELRAMLRVCEQWARDVGLSFNVPKSKVMLLSGKLTKDDLPPPEIHLGGQVMEWVNQFKYLGFLLYSSTTRAPKRHKLDRTLLDPVMYPLTPVLMPGQMYKLFLAGRIRVITTMIEGKVLHNSPMMDLDYKNTDALVNKWMATATGVSVHATSATFMRCELGVLPSKLVAERNAMYFLWHLTHEAWFRQCLPALADLPALSRLTTMLVSYNLTLEELFLYNKNKWHSAVRDAVLAQANVHHEPKQSLHAARVPNFKFLYLGQSYMYHKLTQELAEEAFYMRTDRLPGVPAPYMYHPCLWCGKERGLNGSHLLQCHQLPTSLTQERDELFQLAATQTSQGPQVPYAVLACNIPDRRASSDPRALLVRKTLLLFRKIRKRAVTSLSGASVGAEAQSSLAQLFGNDDAALSELQEAVENDRD